jgi:hypothetical protein
MKSLPEESGTASATEARAQWVARYKQILLEMLNNRPSGTRQRLAALLRKNRSFISQITNPTYSTPIPARHLETLFEVCHFSEKARQEFLKYYDLAHPGRRPIVEKPPPHRHPEGTSRLRKLTLYLPDLGSEVANHQLDEWVLDTVRRLNDLLRPLSGSEVTPSGSQEPGSSTDP